MAYSSSPKRNRQRGREPFYKTAMPRVSIRAPETDLAHLRRIGRGEISRAVRILVEQDRARTAPRSEDAATADELQARLTDALEQLRAAERAKDAGR